MWLTRRPPVSGATAPARYATIAGNRTRLASVKGTLVSYQTVVTARTAMAPASNAPTHDPRIDPWTGDALLGLNGGRIETRHVLPCPVEGQVRYSRARNGRMVPHCVSVQTIANWRWWARKADVVHVADLRT